MKQKKIYLILSLIIAFSVLMFCLSSCGLITVISAYDSARMKTYYTDKTNYVIATGTVVHIKYSDDSDLLCLGLGEDLCPSFDDNSFVIEGKNLITARNNGIDEKVQIGVFIEFVTAPKYFGDGYLMPIVSLIVNGETLLEFEDGYQGLLEKL